MLSSKVVTFQVASLPVGWKADRNGMTCGMEVLPVAWSLMITRSIETKRGSPTIKVLACLAALAASSGVFAVPFLVPQGDIRATVDDIAVYFPDVQPIMVNRRVMVPIRGVFEHMHAEVEWDDSARTVITRYENDVIRLPINSHNPTVNGVRVSMDSPAIMVRGRAMVPLRFLSEALHSSVDWVSSSQTVRITTEIARRTPPANAGYSIARMESGTVVPFTTLKGLSSNNSEVGDTFTASLDTNGTGSYQGLPAGTILEGHVEVARAKTNKEPGVLGLAFDRVRMPDGSLAPIEGALIGLDSKSVSNEDGRLVAKMAAKNDNLKYVGYGAGAGVLVSILTKSNFLTITLIGSALGLLWGEIQKNPEKSRDVTLDSGSKFGVRLTETTAFRVPNDITFRSS